MGGVATPRLPAPALTLLGLALAAAVVAGAPREVVLRPPPFWSRDSTYVAANVGLVLLVVLQMLRGLRERRLKFRRVREAAEQTPAPGPASPAGPVVRCPACAQPLKVGAGPLRFRCPACGAPGATA